MTQPADRPLPSNTYAEQVVLGACLSQQNDKASIFDALTRLELDDFTTTKNRAFFEAFTALAQRGIGLDAVTVYEWFRARARVDDVDGLSGIIGLEEGMPEVLNLQQYVEIIKQKTALRRVIALCAATEAGAFAEHSDPAKIAADLAKDLRTLVSENEVNGPQSIAEFVDDYKGGFDALMSPHLVEPGIPLGFKRFDEVTDGLHEDEIFVIGAPPSSGKTAWGLQVMRNIATTGIPVAIFSMEMSKRALFYRMICDEAQVPFVRFRRGEYSLSESIRLKEAAHVIYQLPLYVDERAGATPADLSVRLKLLKEKHGVRAALLDYIQIAQSNNKRLTGNERMSAICNDLQGVIKAEHTPFIILSQLSRESSKNKREPEMTDYRDSGAIEQIADVGGMIYREELFNRDKPSIRGQAKMLLRKVRNGSRCEIGMRFVGWRMRFEELTEDEEEALK